MGYGNWADQKGNRARRRLMARKKMMGDNRLYVSMLPKNNDIGGSQIPDRENKKESGVFEINISKVEYFQVRPWVAEVRPHISRSKNKGHY